MKRLLLLSCTLASLASASVVVTNTPAWDGSTLVSAWGSGSTPTYGETVTVPTDGNSVLSSFTFEVFGTGGSTISFAANVQAWSGTATIGSPLFSGSGIVVGATGVHAETFNPGLA